MAYIYNLADTWNASGTTFAAIKMNVTDTASAAGSLLMDLQVGGVSKFSVSKGAGAIFATNLIEQRNGVNAQAFNLYNTYTDASNYERGVMKWSSSNFIIGTEFAGTGGTRTVIIDGASVRLRPGGNNVAIAYNTKFEVYTELSALGNVTLSALPTSNPAVAGRLWNDAGTLKVSAG